MPTKSKKRIPKHLRGTRWYKVSSYGKVVVNLRAKNMKQAKKKAMNALRIRVSRANIFEVSRGQGK